MAEAEPHGPDMYASLNNLGLGSFASQVTATAAPLVTQLLEMLAQARRSSPTAPSEQQDVAAQQKTVLLQQEISRIMHENNQLHAALLHSNEVTAEHQQRLQRETKEMETQIADLKFVNSQKSTTIQNLQHENEGLREKVSQFAATGMTQGSARSSIASVQMSDALEAVTQKSQDRRQGESVDLLKISDAKVVQLRAETQRLQSELDEARAKQHSLQDAVQARDAELKKRARSPQGTTRTRGDAPGSDSDKRLHDAMSKKLASLDAERVEAQSKLRSADATISKLRDQNNAITKQNEKLRNEARQMSKAARPSSPSAQNLATKAQLQELEEKLKESARKEARAVADSQRASQVLDAYEEDKATYSQNLQVVQEEANKAKAALKDMQQEHTRVKQLLQKAEQDVLSLTSDAAISAESLHATRDAVVKLEAERQHGDNTRMSLQAEVDYLRKVQKELREDNTVLRSELDRTAQENDRNAAASSTNAESEAKAAAALVSLTQDHERMKILFDNVERERDHYMGQYEKLNADIVSKEELHQRQESQHKAEYEELSKLRALVASLDTDHVTLQQQLADAQSNERRLEHQNGALRGEVQSLQPRSLELQSEVRELYQKYGELEAECLHLRHECAAQKESKAQIEGEESELSAALNAAHQERDLLRGTIQEFENQLSRIQGSVRNASRERDSLSTALQQANAELAQYRQERTDSIVRSEHATSESGMLSKQNAVLETRVEDAEKSLDEMSVQMAHHRSEAEQALRDLIIKTGELAQVTESKQRLEMQLEAMQAEMDTTTKTNRDLASQLHSVQTDCDRMRQQEERSQVEVEQLKTLISEMDCTRKDLTDRLREATTHSHHQAAEMAVSVQAHDTVVSEISEWKLKVDELKGSLLSVDHQREMLQMEVNAAKEDCLKMEQRGLALEAAAEKAEGQLHEAVRQANSLTNDINDKELQIKSMELALSDFKDQIEELLAGKAMYQEQLKRLEDDLVVMTKENQLVNVELMKLTKDKESAQRDLNAAQAKMVDVLNTGKAKERENADLILQYQNLNGEVGRLQLQLQSTEQARDESALQLAHAKQDMEAQAVVLQEKNEEIRRLEVDLRALDINSDSLARDVGSMQAQVQGATDSNATLQQELRDARAAYTASEDHRRKLQSELAATLEANAAFAAHSKNQELELEVTGQQLQLEAKRCSELECLLSEMRTDLHRAKEQPDVGAPRHQQPGEREQIEARLGATAVTNDKPARAALQTLSDCNASIPDVTGTEIRASTPAPPFDFETEAKALGHEKGSFAFGDGLREELHALERVYERIDHHRAEPLPGALA